MKKGSLLLCTLLSAAVLRAQEPSDALRYSWYAPGGTARQQAIGGAMGSLGGDYSATFVNPAGLGFYRSSDALIAPAYHWSGTRATYNGREESSKDHRFDVNALGLVLGGSHEGRGMALSLGFTTQADFRSDLLYRGRNNQSSYSQRFIEELARNGVRDSTAAYKYPFGSSLALNTYWLDPVKSNGQVTGFSTNSPIATGLLQEQQITNRGGIYELAIGGGAQVSQKWFVGATIGVPLLNYTRHATFTEADATTDTSNHFDFASFEEHLTTKGTGLNLRLGAIYKPAEYWRLGLSVQSPTLYSLTDVFEYQVTANTERYQGELYDDSKDYNDGAPNEFKYRMITPWKATGSLSWVLREVQDVTKQRGFLTADVEYVHYRGMRYLVDADQQTDDSGNDVNYFKPVNNTIKDIYKGAFNFRVGGELKFTTIMVRAGAAYYGNPYKESNGGTGNRLNLSGGLGYRDKGFFVDLTYVHSQQQDINAPYRLASASYYVAEVKRAQHNVLLTFGMKF